MSLGVSRAGLDTAGGTIISGSPNVFVNKLPAVRVGDLISPQPGGPVMATGSAKVFVNTIPVCRLNDQSSDGNAASGSSDVFAG